MRLTPLLLALCLVTQQASASDLPDLGEVSQNSFSLRDEARVGSAIMRDIYADPQYYDDPELTEYLNNLGYRLVAASPENRREFQFFVIKDNTLNAFALPGGYIGVHTGLIKAAQSESELAGVLGHEIAHVTQRHLARMIQSQNQSVLPSLAALAVAILAARSNPQVASGALAAAQAVSIQKQLNFTRENEREADRIGLQIMSGAGFDQRGMASFFERLQKFGRLYENNAPAYLRTHPLTTERIADIQNRVTSLPARQVADSLEFQLLRAKLRAEEGRPEVAVKTFGDELRETRFNSAAAAHYGLTLALMRAGQYDRAEQELRKLRQSGATSPMIELLAARIRQEAGDSAAALQRYRDARARFPAYRPLVYAYTDALLLAGQGEAALQLLNEQISLFADDYRLYQRQSRAYALLGKDFLRHHAQAEAYVRQGNLTAAIEQLQIGLRSRDGDFYQMSIAESRLRELLVLNKPAN